MHTHQLDRIEIRVETIERREGYLSSVELLVTSTGEI
jgi:hypothetical protein